MDATPPPLVAQAEQTARDEHNDQLCGHSDGIGVADAAAPDDVDGIADVKTVKIINKTGGKYSRVSFNIEENKSADGRYIVVPNNVAFEVKYPKIDIKGSVV